MKASELPDPGGYVWAVVMARAALRRGKHVVWGRPGFGREWRTEAEFNAEFFRALTRRINARGAPEPTGRKHTPEYQLDLKRDARDLSNILTRRIRVYQFRTPTFRARFAHLLSRYDD